jgi:hypothetical protein
MRISASGRPNVGSESAQRLVEASRSFIGRVLRARVQSTTAGPLGRSGTSSTAKRFVRGTRCFSVMGVDR